MMGWMIFIDDEWVLWRDLQNKSMDGSRKVLQEFSSGLRGVWEAHQVSDSAADGLSVLDNIVVA